MMTRGRGWGWIPHKSDDVIYEKPLTYVPVTVMWPKPIIVQNFFVVTSHMYIPENKIDDVFEGTGMKTL